MSTWGKVRRVVARLVATAAAVFWAVAFFGLIDFVTPFVGGPEFADHFLMETGWGLTFLILVAVPLLVLAARPGNVVALLELVAVGVALGIGAVLAGSPPHLLPGVGVLLTAALLVVLGGSGMSTAGSRPAPVSGLLVALAVLPATAYAWLMARGTDNPEETWGLDHYPVQASFAVAVVLVALLGAYTVHGGAGPWLPVLTAAFSAAWFGAQSVVWPERLGSLGATWGPVVVVWGVALLVAAVIESRRNPVPRTS